jgi:hypothetical protein
VIATRSSEDRPEDAACGRTPRRWWRALTRLSIERRSFARVRPASLFCKHAANSPGRAHGYGWCLRRGTGAPRNEQYAPASRPE